MPYKPRDGESRYDEKAKTWPARRDYWIGYYENGDGYRQAVAEAWSMVVRRNYTRSAFVDAAQWVGWSVKRLLHALVSSGMRLPKHLEPWAAKHAARYKKGKRHG